MPSKIFESHLMCYFLQKIGNSWFVTRKNEIVQMDYAARENDQFFIFGAELKQKRDFFLRPFSSHFVDIYLCDKK